MEAEYGNMVFTASGTDFSAFILSAERMRRIFDNAEIVFGSQRFQCIHIARTAGKMNRDNRFRLRGNRFFHSIYIYIERMRVDIHQYRFAACVDYSIYRAGKRHCCRDYFIARLYQRHNG